MTNKINGKRCTLFFHTTAVPHRIPFTLAPNPHSNFHPWSRHHYPTNSSHKAHTGSPGRQLPTSDYLLASTSDLGISIGLMLITVTLTYFSLGTGCWHDKSSNCRSQLITSQKEKRIKKRFAKCNCATPVSTYFLPSPSKIQINLSTSISPEASVLITFVDDSLQQR